MKCPNCGSPADPSALTFSSAADNFVCPLCRPATEAAQRSATPPEEIAGASVESRAAARPWMQQRAGLLGILGIVLAAVGVTALAIALTGRGGSGDDQLAWERANHDRIIELKSQAEALAIARKLPEAHAKYRELEKMLGGRTVKDPQLFDMVDQARQDQDRVYAMVLRQIEGRGQQLPQTQADQEATTGDANSQATTGPTSASAPPPYPPSLRGDNAAGAAAPTTSLTTSAPTQSPASSLPAGSEQSAWPTTVATTAPDQTAVMNPTSQPALGPLTDEMVGESIKRGADFLVAQFQNGEIPQAQDVETIENGGLNGLALYALLQSSRAINDPRLGIKGEFLPLCIDKLKAQSLENTGGILKPKITYARSFRALALATYNRPQDKEQLKADVKWLVKAAVRGAYFYDDRYSSLTQQSLRSEPSVDQMSQLDDEPVGQLLGLAEDSPQIILMHGRHGPNGEELPAPAPGAGHAEGPAAPGAGYSSTPPNAPGAGYTPRPDAQPQQPTARPGSVYTRPLVPYVPQPTFRNTLPERPYTPRPKYAVPVPWDNSNSQYGLLGVWAGAEVGVEVPVKYWKDVEQHWSDWQQPSGMWNYGGGPERGYFAMTVAGIASLFITHDYLDAPLLGTKRPIGRDPYSPALSAALAWLETGDNAVRIIDSQEPDPKTIRDYYYGYNLFGLERVGLASGFKHLGKHDWYAELAAKVIATQYANGSFGRTDQGKDTIIDTAYVLLFLSRGRHPVMMNKLRFQDYWTNRPRDVANLSAYAGRELERPLNWQVVDVARGADDWSDSPILYLASNQPPKLSEEETQNLEAFVEAGGLLFTHADQGNEAFNLWVAKLAKSLWPDYPLKDLPANHPVYTLNYNIALPRPRLQAVSNGSRLLLVNSPGDIANGWQVRATESRKEVFQLGMNLYLYTTGKEKFRNRLDRRAVPLPEGDPPSRIHLARITYDGNWDPERFSWLRFSMKFENETGTRITVQTAEPGKLDANKFLIALLTGTDARIPKDEDLAPTAKFVSDGGTLLVEATGGAGTFATEIEAWLTKLSPGAKLQPIAVDDPLIKQTVNGTVDLPAEQLRLFASEQIGRGGTRLKMMKIGKGRVIFSPLDISSGLLGTNTWGILGYLPEYSEALAKNLVLSSSAAAAK